MAPPFHSRRTFPGVTLPEGTDFEVGVEAWGRGDYDRAVQEFRLLAEQGHAQAQVNLGIMSSQGRGVPKDFVQAYRWYTLAADQGNGSTHRRSPIWFKLTIPLKLMG